MYDIDWLAPFGPRKKRKWTSSTKKKKKVKAKKPIRHRSERGTWKAKGGKSTGRPKGTTNSPEALARAGKSISEGSWRKRCSNRSDAPMQSATGQGDSDYSLCNFGRVFAHRELLDEDWQRDI